MAKRFFLICFTKETNNITVLDIVNEIEAHKDKLGNINEDVQKYENKSNTFLLEYSNEIKKKRSEESSFYSEIYNRLLCVTEKKKQEKYLDAHEDMESMFKKAEILVKEDKNNENKKESSRYFKICADRGHVCAMFNYAAMLYKGDGIEENKKEASHYYKLAADKGHACVMFK